MHLVVTLKKIRLSGELIDPGEMVRVMSAHPLVSKGYARPLTKEEERAIVDSYIEEAKRVFGLACNKAHYEQAGQ